MLGDACTVADVNVASMLAWAPFAKVDLAPFGAVTRWLAECSARPAARKALGR